jgi:hypothetical protein
MAVKSAEEHPEAHRTPIGLTTSQVAASALAASCAAIVASFLGVAGTISGAAIGSIVATTGSAFYGHAFHHGGKKIVKRLGPGTLPVSDAKPKAATGAQVYPAITPATAARASPTGSSEPMRKSGYGKPVALAAAMLVVFSAAIAVGMVAGGPIRRSGTGVHIVTPSYTVTRQPTTTRPTGTSGTPTATTDPSASASTSSSGSSSMAPSSGSGTPGPPVASQVATGP